MSKRDTLLSAALTKLTAELGKWRENATHVEIRTVKTPFRHSLDIEVYFKKRDQVEDIKKIMDYANENFKDQVSDENAKGDEKKTVEVEARMQGEDTSPLGYHG